MKVKCTNWRSFERNTLLGFCDLEIGEIGLVIRECTVHRKNDRMWIGLPGRPQIDKNGNAVRDPASGKITYTNVLQFIGRSWAYEFNRDAIAAIEGAFPDALREASHA